MVRVLVVFVLLFGVFSSASAAGAYREGDSGEEITAIQSRLASLGYNPGGSDGDFGSLTTEAIKRFQQDRGLETDGVVGADTYRALLGREIPASRDGSSSTIRRVIQSASRYLGVPYVFGGTTPDGFDCSGFTRFVYGQSGIFLPRTADAQYGVGQPVSYNRLQAGDLVFFSTYEEGVSHSGIYLGNGQFISATSSQGVAIASLGSGYWGARYIGARRVL
ncbi:MAG: NlpC/P60 family protein [Negativicutes bacterium]